MIFRRVGSEYVGIEKERKNIKKTYLDSGVFFRYVSDLAFEFISCVSDSVFLRVGSEFV